MIKLTSNYGYIMLQTSYLKEDIYSNASSNSLLVLMMTIHFTNIAKDNGFDTKIYTEISVA